MLRGWFYFRRTTSGNLVGEYSNNFINPRRSFTHTGDLIGISNDFQGTYNSTWLEQNVPVIALLTITNVGNNIFELRWEVVNNGPVFIGNASVEGDLLIGEYSMIQI
ncbi:MAG TPA: hypothetical protein VNB90_14600 [Cytophagaceae bacterium]|jgi:hypothetical protein|nr:hypothetical protein [Cytophagaceae bacterium]